MAALNNWTIGILFSVAFLSIFGIIIAAINADYNKDLQLPFTDNTTTTLFVEYSANAQTQVEGSNVELSQTYGITLKAAYGILKDLMNVIWNFISGGWIENIINLLNLGTAGTIIATVLRILFFISVLIALLYGIFKVAM